ncbi:hypothetical protein [Litorihabitans aurantiacus]|uniref:Uncharacterized protein n=1 Tax=Litorihabitans aurantiacus TaxID=1930061 RepID=A0AA37XEQ9_9MICO|nr:hypothetical protein [Litorihabitans aurantiacus]GMA31891.1 hypothetical protein GCM10025875_18830 [Litorihabitans aurantiacus]
MGDLGPLVPTLFAVVAIAVIAWQRWVVPARRRAGAVRTVPGQVVAATVVVSPSPIARGDTDPTRIGLHVDFEGRTATSWESSRLTPSKFRSRTVGWWHVRHAPCIQVPDRAGALARARAGGVTFDLDPPIPVQVHIGVDDRIMLD